MRRTFLYILVISACLGCSNTHVSDKAICTAEAILYVADSVENTTTPYADTTALQHALRVFIEQERTPAIAKTYYHLGNAYKSFNEDSLAFVSYAQAADLFLTLSDSIYYPLSILELSLIAERKYREEGNDTMLQAIRTIHREVIQTKTTNARKHNILIILLTLVVVGFGIAVYAIYRSNKTFTKSVKREDLERNIALVLSQGKLQTALHWDDYQQLCSTANAYLYDAVDKLQAIQPELSEQDIRFCVLVLLDLSAKEIADIMMLSQNSISNKKTRTAQKLGTIAADLREKLISITLKTKEK